MKYLLLILFFTCCAICYSQDKAKAYIDCYKKIAIEEMKRTGVPACISLAQGLVESGCGEGDLCKRSNNHFGIKCKNEWTGDKVYHDDDLRGECFRSYPTGADSYRDHSDFLKNRPPYAFLFNLDPTDYKAWAFGLKKAGYATETSYPQKLLKVINDYNLNQYTLIALNKITDSIDSTIVADSIRTTITKTDTTLALAKVDSSVGTTLVKDTVLAEMVIPVNKIKSPSSTNTILTEKVEDSVTIINSNAKENNTISPEGETKMDSIFTINHTKAIFVQTGTATLLIAKHFNISLSRLLEMNDMENIDIMQAPQIVFIEPKQTKGATDTHIVKENETLFDISQMEGVRLNKILEYNKLKKGSIVAVGKKVLLQPQIAGKPVKK